MSIVAAFTALSDVRVPDIANNFDARFLPDVLKPLDLPCKITLLADTYAEAARSLGYDGAVARFTLNCEVNLLYSYIPPSGRADRMAPVLGHIDGFLSALQGNWLLGNSLEAAMVINSVRSGIVEWAGEAFIGSQLVVSLPVRVEYDIGG